MPEIGLRELKTHASAILRDVRERRGRYVVTHRGRPVAMLVPIADEEAGNEADDGWDEFLAAADDVGRKWNGRPTVQQIFGEMRR